MDNLGNRTGTITQRDGVRHYTTDSLTNRYTAIDSVLLDYDLAGNLIEDHHGYRYVYDHENRITRIYKLDGQTEIDVAQYAYDALGRRIRKTSYDSVPSVATLYYYSDNWQVLAEYDGSGGFQAYYVFGNYIDEVLLMHRDAADHYYLHDHLYSPVALLDDTGAVAERYEYDVYGSCRILDSNFDIRISSLYGNPYAFTGRELDTLDAGSRKLYHFRHRDYSPDLARFLQNDPLIYVDGLNLYQYTNGNPLQFTDPTGQSACKDCDVIRKAQRPLPNRRSNSTGRVDVRWAIVTSISRDPSCGYRLIIKNGGCRINAWFYSPPEPEMIYPNGETPEDHENTHVRLSASAWSSVKNFADSLNGVCSCSYGLINCLQELIITYLDLKWWANRADNYGYDCRVYFGTTETNPSKKHACLQEVESYNKYQETYRKFDLILNSFRPGSPSHPCGTASPRIGDRSHAKTTDSH